MTTSEHGSASGGPTQPRLVVGVGASAGGLEAFKQFLGALPNDSGMAFLLVQHLDPHHKSILSELLGSHTRMKVTDADQGAELQANTVYIIRPDTALAVRGGKIELSTPTLHRGVRLPVDHLFRSLARDYGALSAGIVLSGAGSDGSAGLRDLKAAGGLTIAQNPDSSGQPGMPQSAIDSGCVDLVLEIDQIPEALERFVHLPRVASTAPQLVEGDGDGTGTLARLDQQQLGRLAALVKAHLSFDLQVYKPATIERRVLRRMVLSGFEEIEPYFEFLREHPDEQQTLVRDMLISVTEFFRDQGAFEALRTTVIKPLVARTESGAELRVWVPGCSTGEEAYSIGIEVLEALEEAGKRVPVQVFATDIDQDALACARAAVYPPSIAERVGPRRLQTYFKALDGKGYQVRQPLRDLVSFAAHDLTKDPPFSRMSLVSCRNVLIYLTGEAQKHVLKVLHFALEPEGHLFLSTSESVGAQRELFATVSKSYRIYQKIGASRPIAVARPLSRAPGEQAQTERHDEAPQRRRPPRGTDLARQAVLEAWAPPTILVAEDGRVTFLHGELGPYLRFPQGEDPQLELSSLLRPGIAIRARGALYRCRRNGEPVTALASVEQGPPKQVRITAKPAPSLGDDVVMLSFEALPATPQGETESETERCEGSGQEAVIDELERELQATREDLRSTVEELETSNEELRSSNEESMSMNEELQSANEELEATTEELRSLNEELTTVNAQLREKVEQLEQAHDDLSNFFSSTKIATLFLDEHLCIKRFTPAARELLSIDATDQGRCIATIARELLQHDLQDEGVAALEHLTTHTRDLHIADGRWIKREVLPYRTESRRIEGVVVTFSDVTALRSANAELDAKNRRLELAWEAARGGIYEYRVPQDGEPYLSDQWTQLLGYGRDDLPRSKPFGDWLAGRLTHAEDRPRLEQAHQDFVEGRSDRCQIEVRLRHRGGHWVWVRAIAKALERDGDGRARHVLGMMIDITDLKRVEQALRESEQRFREMADGLPLMVWVHDARGQQESVNATFCEFFGVKRKEMTGGRWQMLLHPDDAPNYNREFHACISEQRPFHAEVRVRDAEGRWRWVESWGRPRLGADGSFRGFVGTSADITERRELERALRENELRFRTLADNIAQFAWMADSEGSIVWYNKRWYDYTGTTPDDMRGWGWQKVHHPDHIERVVEKISRCFQTGEVWEDTFPLRGADGAYRWFLSRALPIRDEKGAVVRWFGTNTDITAQREAEQRLMQMDRHKDEFLAMLGHELRNPLAAVRSATELLKAGDQDNPLLSHARDVLDRQTAHMAHLLDGLLDVSRIMRGKIEIEHAKVDLRSICRNAVDDAQNRLGQRDLQLALERQPKPLWVDGDRVRLTQIVDNLLSNAVKFTPDGGVIRVALDAEDAEAVLRVRDSGVGIDATQLAEVFSTFWQSTQTLNRSKGGLGLGLALVKSLSELHGGSVAATSKGPGQGAEFIVRLPLADAPAQQTESATTQSTALKPMRLLVIEDNPDAAASLGELLKLSGHQVHLAGDGPRGLELAQSERFDAVLCDLGLPAGMSGFDVARALRNHPGTAAMPLVALSGYGRPEDKSRAREAGFDVHLTKPVDLAVLQSALLRQTR
jgi:two-component system CheB/CheR fusion protein